MLCVYVEGLTCCCIPCMRKYNFIRKITSTGDILSNAQEACTKPLLMQSIASVTYLQVGW